MQSFQVSPTIIIFYSRAILSLIVFPLCCLHLLSLCLSIWKTVRRLCHLEVVLALATFLVRGAYSCFASNGNSRFQVAERENKFRKKRENKKTVYRGECYWNQCSWCNEIRCGRRCYSPSIGIMSCYCLLRHLSLDTHSTHMKMHSSAHIHTGTHTHAHIHRHTLALYYAWIAHFSKN